MNLSFLWHMHQPDYRNKEGIMQMPWVFLHAIKDYYDMPWMMARHKSIKATFNITPTLIEQLKLYYHTPEQNDKFLSLWLRDPALLEEDERKWLIKICNISQFETMVKQFDRYTQLFNQKHLNNNELIDLEVLFILSWCGVYLRTHNDFIQKLIQKQKDYTLDDKKMLLKELSHFISGIFDYYTQLHNDKRITIATTPFYHPILPLLLDMKNATKANINTKIPTNYIKMEDDARLHIKRAKRVFENTFGFEANGFWPAEGAVDTASVKLFHSFGVKWVATDEAILYKSLHVNNKNLIYVPYHYNDMIIAFRDHHLSDLIGFEYRYKKADEAAKHFISQLQNIQNIDQKSTAFVILDGENAWEFYKNNGFDFFEALYTALEQTSWCKSITMDEVTSLPSRELTNLEPGSWINATFDTWVGNAQKTRAWELLFLTKKDYEHHKASLNQAKKDTITDHFLAAECSDWFWWYGEDHYTDFGREFDELFRNHLIDIYDLMEIVPPADLFIPITKGKSFGDFWIKPQYNITPTIDGKKDSFFEWLGCGVIDENKLFSTMDRKRGPIKKIYYGQDDKNLYFLFEGEMQSLCTKAILTIFMKPSNTPLKVAFNAGEVAVNNVKINVICKESLEFSIAKETLFTNEVSLRFEIDNGVKALQILPSFGELQINLHDDYSQNWFI